MENSTCQCFPTTLCVPSRSVNSLGIRKKVPLSLAPLFRQIVGGGSSISHVLVMSQRALIPVPGW